MGVACIPLSQMESTLQGSQIYPSLGEANGPGQPTQTPCLGGAAQLLEDNILRGMFNLLGGNSVILILFQHSKCFFCQET